MIPDLLVLFEPSVHGFVFNFYKAGHIAFGELGNNVFGDTITHHHVVYLSLHVLVLVRCCRWLEVNWWEIFRLEVIYGVIFVFPPKLISWVSMICSIGQDRSELHELGIQRVHNIFSSKEHPDASKWRLDMYISKWGNHFSNLLQISVKEGNKSYQDLGSLYVRLTNFIFVRVHL